MSWYLSLPLEIHFLVLFTGITFLLFVPLVYERFVLKRQPENISLLTHKSAAWGMAILAIPGGMIFYKIQKEGSGYQLLLLAGFLIVICLAVAELILHYGLTKDDSADE
ncbi:MAG: hypothetical protein CMI52_01790 [Parcubacteria group bacterium]|nr:hypothetical protein [Parcubacteria group bacterium]